MRKQPSSIFNARRISLPIMALVFMFSITQAYSDPTEEAVYQSVGSPASNVSLTESQAETKVQSLDVPRETTTMESAQPANDALVKPDTPNLQQDAQSSSVFLKADSSLLTVSSDIHAPDGGIKKKYQVVQYLLKNEQPVHVEILQAEVLNGIEEAAIAYDQAQRKGKKLRGAGLLLRGLSSVPMMGTFAYGSYAALQTASAASNVAGAAANTMDMAAQNTVGYVTGQYNRKVADVIVAPGEIYSFQALIPKDAEPKLKLVMKNLQTNQISSLVK